MTALVSRTPPAPAGARFWPWLPALLLGGLLGTQVVVLGRVLEDPGFALEPDYYRKAVAWDADRELERRSQTLGWRVQLDVDPGAGGAGVRVRAALRDAAGQAVTGARLQLTAFANARAAQQLQRALRESAPGSYETELPVATPGLWEFRIAAQRDADLFRATVRRSLERQGAAP